MHNYEPTTKTITHTHTQMERVCLASLARHASGHVRGRCRGRDAGRCCRAGGRAPRGVPTSTMSWPFGQRVRVILEDKFRFCGTDLAALGTLVGALGARVGLVIEIGGQNLRCKLSVRKACLVRNVAKLR